MGRGGVEQTGVPRTLEESYDVAATAVVPVLGLALCAFSAAFAIEDATTLTGPDRVALVAAAGGTAVLLLALALVTRRQPLPTGWGHPVASGAVLLTCSHPVTAMVLTGSPRYSSLLMVAAAGTGLALVSLRWQVATLYLVWGGWTAAALVVGPSRTWVHYAVGMAVATTVALLAGRVRRSAVRDLATATAAIEAAAVRDQLTGLANRRGLAMVGGQIVEHARRQGDAVHCIFVDIEGLKVVNEHLGNEAGDEVIVAVAEAMREVTRATDVVARWGGDEYCVVGPGPGMAPLELERRVRDAVMIHAPVPPELWPVRVCAGGAMLAPWDSGTLDTLLGKADQEMHLRRSLRREAAPLSRRPASTTD